MSSGSHENIHIYTYGTREQTNQIALERFAHMKKPCSMPTEQSGTSGTKPNLLTPDNKFAQLHQHHHLLRELSSKNSHKKEPIKNPPNLGGLPNPLGLDFDFRYLLGLD